jgi:23S rRNA (cytosine1962-C5)-methyltransferase
LAVVHLRPSHVKPVWAGHPWVFAQAIARIEGEAAAGDAVDVVDPSRTFLGRGFLSPRSAIPVRVLTRRKDEPADDALLARRVREAIAWRKDILSLPSAETDGYRLINSEGDGLPGLVVDRLGEVLVVQVGTIGMRRRIDRVIDVLVSDLAPRAVYEAAPGRVAAKEELDPARGMVVGSFEGSVRFRERGLVLHAQPWGGQKTGFFFDQRENRAVVERLAKGRRVLDAYSYSGAFALSAARGGAREVVAVDTSLPALELGAENARANGLAVSFVRADVAAVLKSAGSRGPRYDLVVLDPPKLAVDRKTAGRAESAYRNANAAAMRALEPGGLLVTCSCSQRVGPELLQRLVAFAARDAGRTAVVLEVRGQAPDHPVPAAFPEGRYLCCLVVRVDSAR